MSQIETAVILAAGLGSRLKPLTEDSPKALTEVQGKPILLQTIETLQKYGIEECVIVVGYLGDTIRAKVGSQFKNMTIKYVVNDIYENTNSMYSAWLAGKYLRKGCILIEGDSIFQEYLIKRVLEADEDKTYWVGDRFRPEFDGSMSIVDMQKRIVDLKIVRGVLPEYKENFFKSTGVLKITAQYGRMFHEWLEEEVAENNVQIYYDLVIAKHLADTPIYIFDITGLSWFEIDSQEDIKRADKIFETNKYIIFNIHHRIQSETSQAILDELYKTEAANTIKFLASKGHTGSLQIGYPSIPCDDDVFNLGLIGYNPLRYLPNDIASFEALSEDFYLGDGELIFKLNFARMRDGCVFRNNVKMTEESLDAVNNSLQLDEKKYSILVSKNHKTYFLVKRMVCNSGDIGSVSCKECEGKTPPDLALTAKDTKYESFINELNLVVKDLNRQMLSAGLNNASGFDLAWLSNPSTEPRLPSFHRKYGLDGSVVTDSDTVRGIGIAARMEAKKLTEPHPTDASPYRGKLRHIFSSLRYSEVIYVSVDLNDSSDDSPASSLADKLESLDRELIAPVHKYLENNYFGSYRLAVILPGYVRDDQCSANSYFAPYFIYGVGIRPKSSQATRQPNLSAAQNTIIKSYEFMDFLTKKS